VIVTLQIVAIARMAAQDHNAVGSVLEGLEYE
jgi:hypothetical protein